MVSTPTLDKLFCTVVLCDRGFIKLVFPALLLLLHNTW